MFDDELFGESNWRGPRRRKPPFYRRWWFKAFWLMLILGVLAAWIGWTMFVVPLREQAETFDMEEIKKLEVASVVYDRDGGELGSIQMINRTPIPLTDVPKHFLDALIAQEDSRFYEHNGVDFTAISRAIYLAITMGRVTQGGSSITQQLAKNGFDLTVKFGKYERKVVEVFLAQRIERYYTKPEILELYLNRIFFGSGNNQNFYGIQSAARGYFAKDAKELTLEESATIAGLIKYPNGLSPIRNPKGATESRNHVIDRMVIEGYITKERALEAQTKPMITSSPQVNARLTYVFDEIRRQVINTVGEERASTGGFRIFTTIDPALQKATEESLRKRLAEVEEREGYEHLKFSQYRRVVDQWRSQIKTGAIAPNTPKPSPDYLQGSAIVIDNSSGSVLAMVGGRDFLDSQYNRAMANTSARATGTAFLPIFYATAFNNAKTFPGTVVKDTFVDNRFLMVGAIEGIAGEWGEETELATVFKDNISAREAFMRSRIGSVVYLSRDLFGNGQTEKVDMPINYEPVELMAKNLGITTPLERYPASFLGKSGAKLSEMTLAYSTFANQGKRPASMRMVNRITDFNDQPIFQITDAEDTMLDVLDPATAYQVHSCLVDSLDAGTGKAARSEFGLGDFPAAGKTGTYYGFKDLWQIGYTSEVTCGVRVGFDTAKTIYSQAYANRIALPIWCDIMNSASTTHKPKPFPEPPQGLERLELCKKSGVRATDFCFDKHHDPKSGKEVTTRSTVTEWVRPETVLAMPLATCPAHTGEGLALDLLSFRAEQSLSSQSMSASASIDPRFSHIQPVRMQTATVAGIDPFESVQPLIPVGSMEGDGQSPVKRAQVADDETPAGANGLPIKLAPPKAVKIE
jgi:membrane peptidoglycan carboxypeptidase